MTSHLQRYEQAHRPPRRGVPTDLRLVQLCQAAHADVDSFARLFALVHEHSLRGGYRPESAPANPPGVVCSCGATFEGDEAWEAHYASAMTPWEHQLVRHGEDLADQSATDADPTGEIAVAARVEPERIDRRALLEVLDILMKLHRVSLGLGNRLPILVGRMAPDYKADVVPIGSRAASDAVCTLCDRSTSRLTGGWCPACYTSWQGWKQRNWEAGTVPDREEFSRFRRSSLEQQATIEAGA